MQPRTVGGVSTNASVSERLPELLTTRQVAEMLAVSPETVLRWYRAGDLPGIRVSRNVLRFDEEEIDEWLEAKRRRRLLAVRPGA